jgi:hypothetical protein
MPDAVLAQWNGCTLRRPGAEVEWRKRTGWPMTTGELERVLRRYPGDA